MSLPKFIAEDSGPHGVRSEQYRCAKWGGSAGLQRLLLLSAAGALLTACAQTQGSLPRPATLSGPASAPVPAPQPKAIVGMASWYGPGFDGHKTASGEVFHQHALTAASNSLPLGSHVKVTNLANGRSVKVRINDCGPLVDGRKIDLSRRAADRLAMTNPGSRPVRIEVLDAPSNGHRCVARAVAHRSEIRSHKKVRHHVAYV